jgi:phage-related protein
MRPVRFLGDSLKRIQAFPQSARHEAGYQLERVQRGDQPDDFKPMSSMKRRRRDSGNRTQVVLTE